MNKLALVEQRTINNVLVEGYYGDNDAWFNREQIGSALGYSHPGIAVGKIHNKHKERLDKFSTLTKTVNVDGKERDSYVYCLRGVLEICRWSKQPKADEVMDKLYDMAISVRDKGYYSTMSDVDLLNMLANKCMDDPHLYDRLNKQRIKDLVEKRIDGEKEEARVILNGYKDKRKAMVDYYLKHIDEDDLPEQYQNLIRETQDLLVEKCPHIEVVGMKYPKFQIKQSI